jgi:hypothetical protein
MTGPIRHRDHLDATLRTMPVRVPPSELTIRLRVLASREAQRRRARYSWSAVWRTARENLRLFINNLMRPLAIPTAGGFVSALIMFAILTFGILAPGLANPPLVARANDIPTVLYTEPTVKNFLPIGFEGDGDLVIEITVDENGKMVDYSIPNVDEHTRGMHSSIQNQILFTQFTPATKLGQRMGGKVKITFLRSSIDVKG